MEKIREKRRKIEGKRKNQRINRVSDLINHSFAVEALSFHELKGKLHKTSCFMQYLHNKLILKCRTYTTSGQNILSIYDLEKIHYN